MKQEDFRKSIKCRVLWSRDQSEINAKRRKRKIIQDCYGEIRKYVKKIIDDDGDVEYAIKRVLDESPGIRMQYPEINNVEIKREIAALLRNEFYDKTYGIKKGEKEL